MPECKFVPEHERRLTHLETIQEIHAKTINTLSTNLGSLTKSINQIKWIGLGALGLYFMQEKGVVEFIKKVIL